MELDFSRRFLVIANPAAGRRAMRRLVRYVGALEAIGCRVDLAETKAPGEAERFARAASPGIYDAVVAAGGDGTINEVANGLLDTTLPLGIIPLGTANVLALDLGIREDPDFVAFTLASGRRRTVHLGQLDGRRFLAMAGIGFDAEVCAQVDLGLKRKTGKFAYVWETLTGAFGYEFPELNAKIDGESRAARGIVICNARHYGGPFVAAPEASLESDDLQVCLLERPGVVNVLRYGAALMLGRLGGLDDVTIMAAKEILVEGPVGAPVHGDGDVLARLPVTIKVAPETIDLLVPDRAKMS